jgi:hypothetical protein
MVLREEIQPLCSALVDGLRHALQEKLYGVYVHGAVTFPETTHTGDIDMHVILRSPPTEKEINDLNALHADLARRFPPFGADIDGHYLLLEEARRTTPPGHQLRPDLVDDSWALHCEHIRAGRCIVLYGPDPTTVYPEPSWAQIEQALAGELSYVADHLAQYPDYCVLNLCRLMYTHQTRNAVVSKSAAADLAIDAFPQWRRLIEAAQASYAGEATDEDRRVMAEDVPNLYRFALREIEDSRSTQSRPT